MSSLARREPHPQLRAGGTREAKSTASLAVARSHISRRLSRRLPYYLTPEEAHQLISSSASLKMNEINFSSEYSGRQGPELARPSPLNWQM